MKPLRRIFAASLLLTLVLTATAAQEQRHQIRVEMGPDGTVTKEAFLAANSSTNEAIAAAVRETFDRLDADHDGSLTVAELMAEAARREPVPKPAGPDDEPDAEPAWPAVGTNGALEKAAAYAVVISETAEALPGWKAVAEALVEKHHAALVVYKGSVCNALPDLARLHPRCTAFVARPEILGRLFVARVHRLTRRLDDDPFTDTLWGIVSASTPEAALRMAQATQPATVHSVISLTGVRNDAYDEIFTISDGKAGDWYWKKSGGEEVRGSDGDADRVQLFIEHFAGMKPDAIVASGHATERNLEMCFSKGNTEVRDGRWVGVANWRRRGEEEREVPMPEDAHPRIFLGAGNCLIGNFHKRADSLAAIMIGRHEVNQFVGYTVPTWYGKGGWGTLGIWQDFGGTYSLAEAWFFNNQVITHELQTRFPASAGRVLPMTERGEGMESLQGLTQENKDENGMMWDRDVVAFYGDPALRVCLDAARDPAAPQLSMKENGNRYRFEAVSRQGGSGTLAMRFPRRIPGTLNVTAGQEFHPILADDFIVIPAAKLAAGIPLRVDFAAAAPAGR